MTTSHNSFLPFPPLSPYHGSVPGRTWLPTEREADEVLRQFFVVVIDDFEVLRSRVVGEAVARALGIRWSPALSSILRPALEKMGARPAWHHHVLLWKGLRPRHFDRADAVALSNTIRGRKRPVAVESEGAA